MKRIGITLLLLGLAMFLGSCFLFVSVPIRSAAANKAISVEAKTGQDIATEAFSVDTSRLCSVSVNVTVTSDQVSTMESLDPETHKPREKYHLRYSFPFRYRILDADGNTIHTEETRIASDSGVRSGDGTVASSQGGTAGIEHHFAKFKVRDPGRIRLEASIEPDSEYGATLDSSAVIVYDNVSRHGQSILTAVGLICFSPLMIIIGAILTIVGLAKTSRRGIGEAEASRREMPGPPGLDDGND